MKRLHLLFILLMGFCSQYVYGATTESTTDFYYCGFETSEAFDQWTIINSNEDDKQWFWEGNGGYACYRSGMTKPANDWLISPTITFTDTLKDPVLKVKFNASGMYNENFAITIGKGNKVEDQTTFIMEETQFKYDTKEYKTIKLSDIFPEGLSGDYNIGFHIVTPGTSIFSLHSVLVTELTDGILEGTLSSSAGGTLKNATVSLQGEFYKKTDSQTDQNGKYSFKDLPAGEYEVFVNYDSHDPFTGKATVIAGETTISDFTLNAAYFGTVSGMVIGKDDAPVKDAKVTLRGDLFYETTTNEDGTFSIEKVRECEKYILKVEKDLKVTYTDEFAVVDRPVDLETIVMETRVAAPLNVKADFLDSNVLLSWMMPLKETEISCDNGEAFGVAGLTNDTQEFTIMGNVFKFPMALSGIKWFLSSANGLHSTADIYIFSLNEDGTLSNNIVYSAKEVPNTDDQWSEHLFEKEIILPHGGILAIGYNGFLGLTYDGEGSAHSCCSHDYREGIEPYGKGNFLVRGIGSPLGVPQMAPSKDFINRYRSTQHINRAYSQAESRALIYDVWRLNVEDKENQWGWTLLDPVAKDLICIDREFNQLPKGKYQYAVQAVYPDGEKSEISFSNEIERLMTTQIKVKVYTNTAVNMSKGAIITLTNTNEPEYTYTKVAEGTETIFDNVKKGVYQITVSREGFKTGTYIWTYEAETGTAEFELEFMAESPFNIQAVQDESTTDVTFRWNVEEGIFEDFEDMEDFAINHAGEIGWTYADVDGEATYGMELCKENPYKNMYEKMAYMVFNPTQTTPNLLEYIQPHSGSKVLIDMALAEGGKNDDYIFSPQLSFETDYILSFYAKAGYFGVIGDEEFMVGYCTEEATPEDVKWITVTPQAVGGMWVKFTYDIPQVAKYVTIRCVSNQKFVFALDDIYIGYKEKDIYQLATYDVYLDDEIVATKVNQRSIVLPKLSSGKHFLKVQAVYPMADDSKLYSKAVETEIEVIKPSGIESVSDSPLFTYNEEAGLITLHKAVDQISIFNMQGRHIADYTNSNSICTSDWTPGLYILMLSNGTQMNTYKVIKK